MKMRIIIAVFVLIGGTVFFGYWSMNQFDNAFDNLSASYVASVLSAPSPSEINDEQISTTSPEISGVLATSTDLELSFTFPQKGNEVYIGCTYLISWQSSTTISSLETALFDAGTRESTGPIASGLAKENTIEKGSQNLKWKIGNVWPGEYYIKVSKINEVESEFRSKVFEINKMSEDVGVYEKENICKESGGSF